MSLLLPGHKPCGWECLLSAIPDIPDDLGRVSNVLKLPFRGQMRIGRHRPKPGVREFK